MKRHYEPQDVFTPLRDNRYRSSQRVTVRGGSKPTNNFLHSSACPHLGNLTRSGNPDNRRLL